MIGMARGTFLYTMTTKEKAFSKFCEHKQKIVTSRHHLLLIKGR